MKKIISILLLAAMLLTLAACGAKPAEPKTSSALDKDISPAQAEEPVKEQEAEPEQAAEPQQEAEPRQEPASEPEAESAEEEKIDAQDMVGEKDATSYANKGLGIRVSVPATWQVLSDEQTAQLMGQLAENVDSESLAEALSTAGSMCDMYAVALDGGGDNVNITIEDLGILYGIALDEEKYLEIGLKNLEGSLGQMGITNIRVEKETFPFAGGDRFSALIKADFNGKPMYERMVLLKVGRYMGLVTSFSFDEGRMNDILNCFEAY